MVYFTYLFLHQFGMCDALRSRFCSSEWSYSDITATRSHFALRQRLATDSSVIDTFTLTR